MTHVSLTVIVLKTVTLGLGGLITYLAARAYQRTGEDGLLWLAVGFGIVTLGALLAGVVDLLLTVDKGAALTIESTLTTIGFAVIVYSLVEI